MWDEKCSKSSCRCPVRIFTTPPGTSDVWSTSAKDMEEMGLDSDAKTTMVFPPAMTGATMEMSPNKDESSGAKAATTPVASGMVKLK